MEGGSPAIEEIPVLFEVPLKRSYLKVTLALGSIFVSRLGFTRAECRLYP